MSTQRPSVARGRRLAMVRAAIPIAASQIKPVLFDFAGIDPLWLCENGRRTQLAAVAGKAQSFNKQRAFGAACRFCMDGQWWFRDMLIIG